MRGSLNVEGRSSSIAQWVAEVRKPSHRGKVQSLCDGYVEGTSIGDYIQHNKPRWLGHVLRMPGQRLPKKILFSMPDSEWRKPKGGQSPTWQNGMKSDKELGISGCEPASWMGSARPS